MSETILEEAQRLVMGARQGEYGHPSHNYEVIAALFNGYLSGVMVRDGGDWNGLTADDAAMLMVLMKIGRYATGSRKRDTVVDIAGYAEVVALIAGVDE